MSLKGLQVSSTTKEEEPNLLVKGLRKVIMSWRQEILNYHLGHISNGRVEGFNRKAKLIQRRGFGLKNFKNYRLVLLNACRWRRTEAHQHELKRADLFGRCDQGWAKKAGSDFLMVIIGTSLNKAPRAGFEPPTQWLTVTCSTDWAIEEQRSKCDTELGETCQRLLVVRQKRVLLLILKA